MQEFFTDYMLMAGMWLCVLAFAGAILMPFVFTLVQQNWKGLIQFLISVAAIGIIFFICYSTASGEVNDDWFKHGVDNENTSRMISGGLNTFFVLAVLAILGIVFSEVHKIIKSF